MNEIEHLSRAVDKLTELLVRRKRRIFRLRLTIRLGMLTVRGENVMTEFPEHGSASASLEVLKENGTPAPSGTLVAVPVWTNNAEAVLDMAVAQDGMSAELRWLDEGTGKITVTGDAGPGKTVVPAEFEYHAAAGTVVILRLAVTEPAVV